MNGKEILKEIIQDFKPESFKKFLRSKNTNFSPKSEHLIHFEDNEFSDLNKIGEINFQVISQRLIVVTAKVNLSLSERSGKRFQYEKAKRILKELNLFDAGLFIFYDTNTNFRLSLVYEQVHENARRTFSNFRRFTYFVSGDLTNKTFINQIGDGDFSTLENIKVAFSVEKVTTAFFDRFREIFEETKQEFKKSNKTICLKLKDIYEEDEYGEQINKFAFTFLGRIIFLYFLQRKGWIENKSNFLREIIQDHKNHGLYAGFLKSLFFDVFAKKEDERPIEIKRLYKDTPYLNGGLFERSPLEIEFPSIFFEDKFIRKIILDFFEVYNFTIDENTSEDQEVSIDPEMLGKVFENTLAEEEREAKGTFYTPREIVHFMVKESLLQFLLNETKVAGDKIKKLVFNYEISSLSKEEIRLIDGLLDNIKVLDPAVGSAAFPVEMMQVLVRLRTSLDVKVGKNINEVELKKKFIKYNLYGVDIDPGAIELAKLRLWLSLVVDYNKSEAEPLPNLDFQFRLGNSLQERIDHLDIFNTKSEDQLPLVWKDGVDKTMQEMLKIKDEFYSCDNDIRRRGLKEQFDEKEHTIILQKIKELERDYQSRARTGAMHTNEAKEIARNIQNLKQKVKDGTYKLFKPDFHFSEVFDRKDQGGNPIKGFDIVIGNPPYGVKVEENIKEWHGLGSRDSYGIFIATSLKRFLKERGVLSFIVSDTWLTIKTHKELREQVLAKQLHKVVRMHQDCFEATVNACIISTTNSPSERTELIVADLTNISTRKEIYELRDKLYSLDVFSGQSTPKFAVYRYKQDLVKTNSNLPIFVGSPKLFELMNDTTCKTTEKEIGDKEKSRVKVRQIQFNDKEIELVRLGDISEIKQGLATGDNDYYLFQNPEARGSYKNINEYKEFLLSEKDLETIVNNEALRLKVIERGFHKSKFEKNFDEDLWFRGRYIVPYDKGGESDTESGWLPNYYVPTEYYIDWSQESIHRLTTLTTKQRNKLRKDEGGNNRPCSRFQNKEYYFREGITFSWAGVYCPTFRKGFVGPFDHGSSDIFCDSSGLDFLLGVLCSKTIRLLTRVIINHTVNFGIDDVKDIPVTLEQSETVIGLVKKVMSEQQKNKLYDYMSREQKEIDKFVYEMYGLNKDDIREVETWYARRYSKLARFADIK